MRVLITGGAGFIGSHLCDFFVNAGNRVTILDNLSTGSIKNIVHLTNKVKVVNGDTRNKKLVNSLVNESDTIIHMAAAVGVNKILDNTLESISTNVYGSEVVMNSALKFGKRLLIASTSEIYGKNLNQPLSETDDRVIGPPQKIRWTYSDAKAIEESMAHFLYMTAQLKVTILRFFNTVGPRQTGKYGMVVPRFIESAVKNKPIVVYGDGTQSRVFCHVYDTILAVVSCLNNDISIGQVYNVGGISEITINELANLVKSKLNSSSSINYIPYEKAYSHGFEDIQRRVPNISKIKSQVNWAPSKDINEIIIDIAKSLS